MSVPGKTRQRGMETPVEGLDAPPYSTPPPPYLSGQSLQRSVSLTKTPVHSDGHVPESPILASWRALPPLLFLPLPPFLSLSLLCVILGARASTGREKSQLVPWFSFSLSFSLPFFLYFPPPCYTDPRRLTEKPEAGAFSFILYSSVFQ